MHEGSHVGRAGEPKGVEQQALRVVSSPYRIRPESSLTSQSVRIGTSRSKDCRFQAQMVGVSGNRRTRC